MGLLVRVGLFTFALLVSVGTARGEPVCDPDGVQASGSIYRICMPASTYNGILVVLAHGFQDAGTPVGIPEDQLSGLSDVINGLGFAFATTSYSKTGLAVVQGAADIVDLVTIFIAEHGRPQKVYLVGASEGALITALNVERSPDIFSAGLSACGPVGDFPTTIAYFADARATFEYFFPGVIPGDPFAPNHGLETSWPSYYEHVVNPIVFNAANRHLLDQWVAVAKLPFDADNYLPTVEVSVRDVLRYGVINFNDAAATLRGFPFDNTYRWYTGSDNDLLMNLSVTRVSADPTAVAEMRTFYNTTGVLSRPLVTLHTLRDQLVPYFQEQIYFLKTLFSGSLLTRHFHIPVDRYGHCSFSAGEVLVGFAIMLLYDGVLEEVSGTASFFPAAELAAFERLANAARVPYRRGGPALAFKLRQN